MGKGNAEPKELSASITKVQYEFLEALVATGEIATSRAGVVQHLIAQEIERLRNLDRMPPKVIEIEAGDGEEKK